MSQMHYATSMAWPTAPAAGRRARMRGQSSTTFRWCTTGSAWCATNVTTTLSTSSVTLCCHGWQNCQPSGGGRPWWVSLIWITASRRHAELISPNWESEQRSQGELDFPQAAILGTPCPLAQPWRRTRCRRHHQPTCNIPSPVFPHIWTRQQPATLESHKTSASSVGLYKLKIES